MIEWRRKNWWILVMDMNKQHRHKKPRHTSNLMA